MDEETTNAVLKEMIVGLTKITDDRLLNLKEGVAEIKLLMKGFITTDQLEEVKKDFNKSVQQIRDGFHQHNEDDKTSFSGLKKGQEDLSTTVKTWGGGLAVVIFLIGIILPMAFHYLFGW